MSTQKELDLLIDISKLLKKYGPDTFDSLAKLMSSPEISQNLSQILTQSSSVARSVKENKAMPKKIQQIPKSLIQIENEDPEKYQILAKFYKDLITKTVLPSMKEINQFLRECELDEIHSRSRERAIITLINSLISIPNDDLRAKIKSLNEYKKGDRSLEGWAEIILNKKNLKNE